MNTKNNKIIFFINEIIKNSKKDLLKIKKLNDLNYFKSKYLGKKSYFKKVLNKINSFSIEDKKNIGNKLNNFKKYIYNIYLKYKKNIKNNIFLNNYNINLTISYKEKIGSLHPISILIMKIEKKFIELGFDIIDCKEIENSYNNFDLLNIDLMHPTRDKNDTFWINNNNLLRTHTSNIISKIKYKKIPIKIISHGKVYRKDKDKTHSPMFHQLEGVYIDKNINFSNLKFILNNLIKYIFDNKNIKIKYRNSYFPFTEPSIELDIYYNNKWIEILGAGMISNNILKINNINNKLYSGIAFGIGIERLVMIKYNINDINLLFKNDLRLLKQFRNIQKNEI